MARSMSSMSVSFRMQGTLTNSLTDGSGPSVQQPSFNYSMSGTVLTSGINSNQCNRGWQSRNRSLGNGASETLDLYDMAGVDIGAGAGLDGVGQAIVFEEIVGIVIVNENDVDEDGALEISPAAANGWNAIGTHSVANDGALYGQGVLIKFQPDGRGLDIVDGATHKLTFTANGGDVTYSIYLLARHDDEESSSSSSSSSPSSTSSTSSSSASSESSSSSSSVTSSSFSSHSSSSSGTSSSSSSSVTSSSSSESSSSWSAP